jgi:dolichyl-diphosphooligosaccharide--protein glycosyltransferase
VIISWWDYGYWITVMGNRTSAADNSTINGSRIAQIGQMFMSNATQAARIAKQIATGPDGKQRPVYILEFITGSILPDNTGTQHYILQVPSGAGWFTAGGGDESKKQWFIRIGGLNESQFLECVSTRPAACSTTDDFNLTPYGAQSTLFGRLLPFRYDGFIVPSESSSATSVTLSHSNSYEQGAIGTTPVPPFQSYSYPYNPYYGYNSTQLFRLAYLSPSITNPTSCPGNSQVNCFNGIVVYQVL